MIDRSLFINFFRSIIRGYLIFDIYEGFEGIYYKSFVSFETYHRINYHSFKINNTFFIHLII
jgi:hypothetical protein